MANNEIGTWTLNGQNRREAIAKLKILKEREKDLFSKQEILIEDGKRSVITHYTKKKP